MKFVIIKKRENVNMYRFIILILMITNFKYFLLKWWSYSLINESLIIISIIFIKVGIVKLEIEK